MARKKKADTPVVGGQEHDQYKTVDQYEIDAFNLVSRRMKKAVGYNDILKTKMSIWMDMFMSRLDKTAKDVDGNLEYTKYRSRLASNVVEKTIRALLAKYISSLLIRKPFFDIHPRELTDQDLVDRVKALLIYTFDKMPDFLMNMVTFVQEMLIFGTAVGKVYWRKVARKTSKGEVVEYEGAYFEPIHRENFFIDPNATKLDGFWKVHQTFKTLKQLKADDEAYKKRTKKPLYKNLDKVTGTYHMTDEGAYTIQTDLQSRGLETTETEDLGEYARVKLWEYWAEDNSRVIVVANENIVIYDGENPYKSGMHPFVRAVYSPVPFEFDGRGVCEQLHDDYVQLNAINNQIMENVKLVNNCMFIGLADGVAQNQIVSRAGKIIRVSDTTDNLVPLPVSQLSAQIYELRNYIERKIEEITASTSSMTAVGAPISKEQSATEVAVLNRLGNEYHGLTLMLLEVPALIEIVRKSYLLIQQFATDAYVFNVTGEADWNILNPEDLQDFDIIPKCGIDVMSPEAKINFLTQLMANLGHIPGLSGELVSALLSEIGTMLGIHFSEQALQPQQPQMLPGGQTGVGDNVGSVGSGAEDISPQARGGMTSRPGGAQ